MKVAADGKSDKKRPANHEQVTGLGVIAAVNHSQKERQQCLLRAAEAVDARANSLCASPRYRTRNMEKTPRDVMGWFQHRR